MGRREQLSAHTLELVGCQGAVFLVDVELLEERRDLLLVRSDARIIPRVLLFPGGI